MSLIRKHWFPISCVVIILIAAIIRLYQLGNVPGSLYWDEAAMLVDAKSVAATGQDMHGRSWFQVMFPSYGDYKLPVYIILSSVSVLILGASEFALRLPSALAGIASVALAGAISTQLLPDMSKLRRRLTALATMLVVAVTPWSVTFSRTAFEGHLAQFWVGSSVFLLLRFWEYKWVRYVAAILGAVATYTYFSVRFIWPVLFFGVGIWFLWRFFMDTNTWKESLNMRNLFLECIHVVLPFLLFVLLLIPMFQSPLYEASNTLRFSTTSILKGEYALESNQLRELAGNAFIDRGFFHRHWLLLRAFLDNVADFVDPSYLFLTGDPNLRHGTGQHGVFLLIFAPFFVLGLLEFSKKKQFLPSLFLLILWWMVSLIPGAVPEETPHALRTLNALLPLSIIIGMGISSAFEWSRKQRPHVRISTWITASVLLLISVSQFLITYFTAYNVYSASYWQAGYQEAAVVMDSNISELDRIYTRAADNRLFLWYLAYGTTTPEEYQKFPTTTFRITDTDGIFYEEKLPRNDGAISPDIDSFGILEDYEPDPIEDTITEITDSGSFAVREQIPISDYTGADRYQLLIFERK